MEEEFSLFFLRLDYSSVLSWACGLIILILVCTERFDQPTNSKGSFVQALAPSAVSQGFVYRRAFLIYVGILLAIYTLLSACGPVVLKAFNEEGIAGLDSIGAQASGVSDLFAPTRVPVPAWWPLAVLLGMTGAATQLTYFNQVEFFARRVSHRLLGIPQSVESLAENIQERRILFRNLTTTEQNDLIAQYNQVSEQPANSLQDVLEVVAERDTLRQWLRLCFLYERLTAANLPARFAGSMQVYRTVSAEIHRRISEIQARPGELKLISVASTSLSVPDQEARDRIKATIGEALHDVHALIAVGICSLARDHNKVKLVTDALRLESGPVEDDALFNRVGTACVFLAIGIGITVFSFPGDQTAGAALTWATGAFTLHGAAALAAWRTYQKRTLARKWEPLSFRDGTIPILQYFGVWVRGCLWGLVALFCWNVLYVGFTPEAGRGLARILNPSTMAFAAVGGFTAFWIAYDFDLLKRKDATLPRRIAQVFMQGAVTAGAAWFIDDLMLNGYMQVQVAVAGFVAGVILGSMVIFLSQEVRARVTVPREAVAMAGI